MAIVKLKGRPSQTVNLPDVRDLESLQQLVDHDERLRTEVDVNTVAQRLGLRVVHEAMEDDISGYLEQRDGQWLVGVNAYHHPRRQRFTIAHEIAHYVLHRNSIHGQHKDFTFARRNERRDRMEVEADDFAAQLLMPEAQVQSLVQKGIRGINELAASFGVSVLAMQYRLRALDYSFG